MIPPPVAILSAGVLILLVSLPLKYRKIPMNRVYGIRIKASFESEQRWYDINAYGGSCMAAWSWPIIIAGVVGFFIPFKYIAFYGLGSAVVALFAAIVPLIQVLRMSRRPPQ